MPLPLVLLSHKEWLGWRAVALKILLPLLGDGWGWGTELSRGLVGRGDVAGEGRNCRDLRGRHSLTTAGEGSLSTYLFLIELPERVYKGEDVKSLYPYFFSASSFVPHVKKSLRALIFFDSWRGWCVSRVEEDVMACEGRVRVLMLSRSEGGA